MRHKGRIARLVSAGGVVYRRSDAGEIEVVLCGRTDSPLWTLPKGTPDPGESREQTAVREVREETGLEVELQQPLKSISYWLVSSPDEVRSFKRVYYYLMRAVGGSISAHDSEFDTVQWFPAQEALQQMTYRNEQQVVAQAVAQVTVEQRGKPV